MMETLQENIELQEQYLSLVATEYLESLNTAVQQRLDAQKPVTLALHTRQFRLARILQVLEELIIMEMQLLDWYNDQDDQDPEENDLHTQIQNTLSIIEKASRRIEQDWGDGEEGKSIKTDTQLEKKIARLQECVEVVLNRFKTLIAYLKYYDLLPSLGIPTETVKFYGNGLVRPEVQVLQTLMDNARKDVEDDEKHYSMLDTPKIDILLLSLPQKYVFDKAE